MNELEQFNQQIDTLLNGLKPAQNKKKFREIGKVLRKANQQRITQQVNTDGSAYEPRKRKPNTVKKAKKMLINLRKAKHMKVKASSDGVAVGFAGLDATIASVHQFGAQGQVTKKLTYDYPVRELLGINQEDKQNILDILLQDEL